MILAWPVILEMSGVMITGAITTAIVGRLGAIALAAVGLAMMVQFSATMVFAAFGTGSAALVARETGAQNFGEVRRIAGQSILLGLFFGVIVSGCGILGTDALFSLSRAETEVALLSGELLKTLFLFTPALLIMSIGNASLRGQGKTKLAFWISSFANLTAIVLSFVLIFGYGVPAMGPVGAAWSTGISQLIGATTVLVVLSRDAHIKLRPSTIFTLAPEVIRRIVVISVPAAIEQVAFQGGRVVFTFLLATVGAVQFAAHQIALQVEAISFLPGFGFSVAIMTLVGQSLGQRRSDRAIRFTRQTAMLTLGSMSVMSLLFIFFARPLTGLFIDDPEVIAWGSTCVQIAAFEQPTIALTYVFSGALRGAGDTRWPMYVTSIGIWLFRIPLGFLFIHVWGWSILSAWCVMACDFSLRSFLLWRRFSSGKWQFIKV